MLFNIHFNSKIIQVQLENKKETYYFDSNTGTLLEYVINEEPRTYPYKCFFFISWLNNFDTFINKLKEKQLIK